MSGTYSSENAVSGAMPDKSLLLVETAHIVDKQQVHEESRFYLPGLNGLRAIAALMVLFSHIDQQLPSFNLSSLGYHAKNTGAHGVAVFFVLSGYLITYLMLIEKAKFGRVALKDFYMRRILRIWPVYYVTLLVTLVLAAAISLPIVKGWEASVILYGLLMANIGYALGYGAFTIAPLWSVGVEEQFYLLWPMLVNRANSLLKVLLFIIIGYLVIDVGLRLGENSTLYILWNTIKFDILALGGLGAYLVYKKSRFLQIIYNPLVQASAWLLLLITNIYRPIHLISLIDLEFSAVFYAIIIINVSSNPKTLIKLEAGFFRYIGRISYGIYVYHMTLLLLLSLALRNSRTFGYIPVGGQYLLVIGGAALSTIALSHLSFNYFEKRFLRLKDRFARVLSTN